MSYDKLVAALRGLASGRWRNCEYTWFADEQVVFSDAADAIEALQAEVEALKHDIERYVQINAELTTELEQQMPKRGKWIQHGNVGWPEWKCSVCGSIGRGDYLRCPWCGAIMYDSNASNALNALDNVQDGPIITPCRGCSDYDGYGGCKSKGGCSRAKMEVQDADT